MIRNCPGTPVIPCGNTESRRHGWQSRPKVDANLLVCRPWTHGFRRPSRNDVTYLSSYNDPFIIRHLSEDDGGGFLIEFPDLRGCISDGETIEEAINNGVDAVNCWLIAAKELHWLLLFLPKP